MKLLMALSAFPYPCDTGAKLRAYQQLRFLANKNSVFLVCLSKEKVDSVHLKHVKKFCKEVHIVQLPKWRRILNLATSLTNPLPFQVNYCYSPEMRSRIADIIKKQHIGVCFVQQARICMNIPFGENCKFFLDYMDSYATFTRKKIEEVIWYEKPLLRKETERLSKFETDIAGKFNGYSVISNADKDKFDTELAKKLQVIPNGVDEQYLNHSLPLKSKGKKYDIIFTGNMNYPPNVQASIFLVEKVLPLLSHRESLKVCIAGAKPAPQVWALENHRAVSVTGFVTDLREYLSAARIFVSPIFSEASLQNKVLEAMALGLPVLASPETSRALGAETGRDLIECSDEHAFAAKIDEILNNEAEAHRLGQRGSTFVKENYHWEAANRKLELSLLSLVKNE